MPTSDAAAVLRLLSEPALLLGIDGTILAWNESAGRAFGLTADGRSFSSLFARPDEARQILGMACRTGAPLPAAARLVERGETVSYRLDAARVRRGGSDRLVVRLRRQTQTTARFRELSGHLADAREEMRRRRRAERRLEAQVELLQHIARGGTLADSLDAIARFIEDESGDARASVLRVVDGVLHHGAGPSLPPAYCEAIDGTAVGPRVGSCGTAAFRGETVAVEDIATNPLWADFRELALEHGLKACISTPVLDRDGEVVATVAHYFSEPRAPDADEVYLARLAGTLVRIAIERFETEEALRARATELAEMNARTHEFLAMLGHELRNPLSPVATSLELLSDPSADEAQRIRWSATAQRQLSLLTRLVDDLLDVARVTRGKVELRRRVVDLRELIERDCVPGVSDPRVRVRCDADTAIWVDVDPERIQQVVGNLLHNARKFTPPDGHIEVSLTADGETTSLSVSDDGVGIAPDKLARMFDLFTQAETGMERAQGGLGLGLALARSLAQLHGGALSAESDGPGRGARFTLALPLTQAPASAPEVAAVTPEVSPVRRLRVLVVDDNEDAAELLVRLLARWGHDAHAAYDGREGIERAEALAPDLVVLDIGLPAMDGFTVAAHLRAESGLTAEHCTLVALTGYGQTRDRDRATESGFDAFLVKPVDVDALRNIVDARSARG